jgi:2-desacetyl-2-hydroxyethyl bacteriochlorophyllide A dehydrogenase
MQAIVYSEKKVHYSSCHPIPRYGEGDVMVQMLSAGMCGTDLRICNGSYYQTGVMKSGVVLGHEGVGKVVELGIGVDYDLLGKRVVFETVDSCGICSYCISGLSNACLRWQHIGINRDGTFAEFVTVPARMTHSISPECNPRAAALAEPVALALHTLERIGPCINLRCLIIGPGPLGLFHAVLLLLAGAREVATLGRPGDEKRLAVAQTLGVHLATISDAGTPSDWARLSGKLHTFDVVIETAGTAEGINGALELCRDYGHVALLGLVESCSMRTINIIKKNLTITGRRGILPRHIEGAVRLIESAKIPWETLVTHTFCLGEISEALRIMETRQAAKVLFELEH